MKKLLILLLSIMLIACNSDDDDDKSPSTLLKGTVVTGASQVATVYIKSADGSVVTARSDEAGNYSKDIGAKAGPFIIKIVPDDTNEPEVYSFAPGVGTANGTQFTTLAMFLVDKQELSALYDNWEIESEQWSLSDIEDTVAKINANLAQELRDVGVDPLIFDFFTNEFETNSTGIDAFLDEYTVEIDFDNSSYQVTDSNDGNVTIDEFIDTSGYFVGALFSLDVETDWVVTFTLGFNGESTTLLNEFPVFDTDSIPFSRARFIEESWEQIESQSFSIDTEQGSVTVTVLGYEPTYSVQGDGGVGTKITAGTQYQYTIKGNVQGQQFDETYSYSFSWVYERIN